METDIREISHRFQTLTIVCVSRGVQDKHLFCLINKLRFVWGHNCSRCKLDPISGTEPRYVKFIADPPGAIGPL